jgi:hypothetical protein
MMQPNGRQPPFPWRTTGQAETGAAGPVLSSGGVSAGQIPEAGTGVCHGLCAVTRGPVRSCSDCRKTLNPLGVSCYEVW